MPLQEFYKLNTNKYWDIIKNRYITEPFNKIQSITLIRRLIARINLRIKIEVVIKINK